eukprot:1156630-Pelagomonas_calceolata.AAC.3
MCEADSLCPCTQSVLLRAHTCAGCACCLGAQLSALFNIGSGAYMLMRLRHSLSLLLLMHEAQSVFAILRVHVHGICAHFFAEVITATWRAALFVLRRSSLQTSRCGACTPSSETACYPRASGNVLGNGISVKDDGPNTNPRYSSKCCNDF